MIQPGFQGLSRSSPDGNARRMSTNLSRKPGIAAAKRAASSGQEGHTDPEKDEIQAQPFPAGPSTATSTCARKNSYISGFDHECNPCEQQLIERDDSACSLGRVNGRTNAARPSGGDEIRHRPLPVPGNVGRSQKWQDPVLTPFCQRPRPSMLTVCDQRTTTPAIPFYVTSVSLVERTVRS